MKWLISLCLATLCWSCQTTTYNVAAEAPENFATQKVENGGEEILRSVSFSGVNYRVRKIPNEQSAAPKFWVEGLEKHLLDSGYSRIKKVKVSSGDAEGAHVIFAAAANDLDYRFSFTLLANDKWIVLAEAAGLSEDYNPVKKEILVAAKGIKIAPQ